MLTNRRNEAVSRGLYFSRSLSFTASLVDIAVRDSISDSRALSRAAGISRLRAESAAIGFDLARLTSSLADRATDVARASLYARNYAAHWLAKAGAVDGKAQAAATTANAATRSRLSLIATSESSDAFNRGRTRVIRATAGVELLRVWDSQIDACPKCRPEDGTIVGVRDNFPLGEPGSVHPRCLCTWELVGQSELASLKQAA